MTAPDEAASPGIGLRQAWNSLGEAASRRALGWRRLSEALDGPNPDWIGDLITGRIEGDMRLSVAWLDSDRELFAAPLAALHRFVESFAVTAPATLETELNLEHARLFIGPERVPASPYESVWMDVDPDSGEHVFGGPSTAAVLAVYRQHGLVEDPNHHDLPDHVATEMEFCCYLCEREAQAWRDGLPEQAKALRTAEHDFLSAHLARFAPDLCAAVQAAAAESCYAAFAGYLLAYLTVESGAPYVEVVTSMWNSPGR